MKIILCGYMGSGKSEIGHLLANKLGLNVLDLDREIEQMVSKKIPAIFSEKGEIFFRKKENEVLQHLLAQPKDAVISLGGGTPCYANNLALIKATPSTVLVYLKVKLEVLTERLFNERKQRPLIAAIEHKEDLEDYVRKHLFERQYYYMQSDVIVDTSEKNPTAVVNEIRKALH